MEEDYGIGVSVALGFEEAVARTRLVMRAQGFSILSEMAAAQSHLFMGMWSRLISTGNLGGQGLDVGDHLACNVVVFKGGESSHVAVLDPAEGMEGWADAALAQEASEALHRLLEEIASPAS